MAKIKIINENTVLEVPEGGRVLEYAKESTFFPYGCENAECATCMCMILKGIENLEPANHKEWVLLRGRGAYPNQRLGCQLRVKKEECEIEIEY